MRKQAPSRGGICPLISALSRQSPGLPCRQGQPASAGPGAGCGAARGPLGTASLWVHSSRNKEPAFSTFLILGSGDPGWSSD